MLPEILSPLVSSLISRETSARVAKGFKRYHWLWRSLAYSGYYAAWIVVFRLLVVTIITYFLVGGSTVPGTVRFQDITDSYGANEVSIMGLCSLIFVSMLRWLNPITTTTTGEIVTLKRLEKRFFPGFVHGAVLATGVISAFVISGVYRYLGFFIQFEEAPLAMASVLMRVSGLALLVYCEEFIFRDKMLRQLKNHLPDAASAVITAACYCGVKALQFDLGLMHVITLFLISIALFIRTMTEGDFTRGAGFWAAILIVFHPLLSLPILGNDFAGIFLVKYQSATGSSVDTASATTRFFTGGAGGPIASFAFQLVLVLDIARSILRHKKVLLTTTSQRLN